MHTLVYSHYVGNNVAVVSGANGFGAVYQPGNTELISPIYYKIVGINLDVETLLVFEKRFGKMVIGIYSIALHEWLHRPQFTDVSIKDLRTLWIEIGKLKGECDITTGKITWLH